MKFNLLKWLPVILFGISLSTDAATIADPYGICAHISHYEKKSAAKQLECMREINIGWVRTDFAWPWVEKQCDQWNFNDFDRLQSLAKAENIHILPILGQNVKWAMPAYKNLDAWGNYVNKMVLRYGAELRYWEIWNEPNASWGPDTPNGKDYMRLLKRAYEEIKKIDPALTVLYGGTAAGGMPLTHIRETLAAGGGKYFDVVNIHPYHREGVPELMIDDIKDVQALLKKWNLNKPVWITEMGYSTAPQSPTLYREILPAAFKRAGIDPKNSSAALLCDLEDGWGGALHFDPSQTILADFDSVKTVRAKELKELNVEKYRVLIPALGEDFPIRYISDLLNYVQRGGTLVLPSGVPFYYDHQRGAKREQVGQKYLKLFHIGWDAWWQKAGIPKEESWQRPATEFEGQFSVKLSPTGRFLHDRNLKPGDQFIPIIEAGSNDFSGVVAALYKFDSDLKGNVIVCTTRNAAKNVTEEQQAEFLPRTYLIALANGVERVFWYCFRSDERAEDATEGHFGIVRKDLKPKPAWRAYRTLTELCPSGSTVPKMVQQEDCFLANWIRPDGVKVWAIWTMLYPKKIRLKVDRKISRIINHLGEEQPLPQLEYSVSSAILYLVGPETVSIQ